MNSIEAPHETEIAKLISETCLNSVNPLVSGSTLGMRISEEFPSLNFKNEYKSLSSFIRNYCSSDILVVGKRGVDLLFIHKKREQEGPELKEKIPNPWVTFSNPRLNNKLFVHPNIGELRVLHSGSIPDEGFVEINRLSESDYREMANEFILKELPQDAEEKLQILKENITKPDFWFEFVKSIENQFGSASRAKILKWRIVKVNHILKERLSSLGLNETAMHAAMNQAAKKPFIDIRSTTPKQRVPLETENFLLQTSPSRELIHEAINLMTIDELRRMRLPVGVIIDALKKLS